jgi:Holliday junction DNA helicase RuvB
MEDHVLDLIIGEGPSARSIRIDLEPFTLVAATTRAGLLATPLRDRFGIPLRLEFYTPEELQRVLNHASRKMGAQLTPEGAAEIAARSRGTPRVAGRLLRRVRDFSEAEGASAIDRSSASRALARLEVDEAGLDSLDRRYLRCLIEHYGSAPPAAASPPPGPTPTSASPHPRRQKASRGCSTGSDNAAKVRRSPLHHPAGGPPPP